MKKIAVFLPMLLLASVAEADETRFTLEEFGSGFLILNDQSNIVSTCNKTEDGFACKFQKDSLIFFKNKVQNLEETVRSLEAQLSVAQAKVSENVTGDAETTLSSAPVNEEQKAISEPVGEQEPVIKQALLERAVPPTAEPQTLEAANSEITELKTDKPLPAGKRDERLVSAEMRAQLTTFFSTLVGRLYDFVDAVKVGAVKAGAVKVGAVKKA